MPVIGSDYRRECLLRLLRGSVDLDGVGGEDIAAAESLANSMGIQPYWIEAASLATPEAVVSVDPSDIVAVAEDRLAFAAKVMASAKNLT